MCCSRPPLSDYENHASRLRIATFRVFGHWRFEFVSDFVLRISDLAVSQLFFRNGGSSLSGYLPGTCLGYSQRPTWSRTHS